MRPSSIHTLIWAVALTAVLSALLMAIIDSGDAGVPDVTPRAMTSDLPRTANGRAPPSPPARARDVAARRRASQ